MMMTLAGPGHELRERIESTEPWNITRMAKAIGVTHPTLLDLFKRLDEGRSNAKDALYVRAIHERLEGVKAPEPLRSVEDAAKEVLELTETIYRILASGGGDASILTLSRRVGQLLAPMPEDARARVIAEGLGLQKRIAKTEKEG